MVYVTRKDTPRNSPRYLDQKHLIKKIIDESSGDIQLKDKIEKYVSESPYFNLEDTLDILKYIPEQSPSAYSKEKLDAFARYVLKDLDVKNIKDREELQKKYPIVKTYIDKGFEHVLPKEVKDIYTTQKPPENSPTDKPSNSHALAAPADVYVPSAPAPASVHVPPASNPRSNQNRNVSFLDRIPSIRSLGSSAPPIEDDLRSNASSTGESTKRFEDAVRAGQDIVDPEQELLRQQYNQSQKPAVSGADIAPGTDIREGFTSWMLNALMEAGRQPNRALPATIPTSSLTRLLDEKFIPFLKTLEKRTPQENQLMDLYDEMIQNKDIPSKSEQISDKISAPITKEELSQFENEGFGDMWNKQKEELVERHEEERQNRLRDHDRQTQRAFHNSWNGGARRVFEKEFQEREDRINRDFQRTLARHSADVNYRNKAESMGRAMALRDLAARQAASQLNIENNRHSNTLNAARDQNLLQHGIHQRKLNTFGHARQEEELQRARAQQDLERKNHEEMRQANHNLSRLGQVAQISAGGPGLAPQQSYPHQVAPYQAPNAPRSAFSDIGGGMFTAAGLLQQQQAQNAQNAYYQARTNQLNNQNVNPKPTGVQ